MTEIVAVCPCGAEVKGNPNRAKDRRRKYCSPGCSGRYNGIASATPPTLVQVRCPCGTGFEVNRNRAKDRGRKYCSQACSGRYNGAVPPRPPASPNCVRCGTDMTRDENVYVDKDGRRHCKNCKRVRNQGRSPTPAVRKPRARKPKAPARVKKPLSIPAPVKAKPEPVKAEPVEPAPTYRRWLVARGFEADVPVRRTR